jgi:hypothetical protein
MTLLIGNNWNDDKYGKIFELMDFSGRYDIILN